MLMMVRGRAWSRQGCRAKSNATTQELGGGVRAGSVWCVSRSAALAPEQLRLHAEVPPAPAAAQHAEALAAQGKPARRERAERGIADRVILAGDDLFDFL